jgi:hypothetical protein
MEGWTLRLPVGHGRFCPGQEECAHFTWDRPQKDSRLCNPDPCSSGDQQESPSVPGLEIPEDGCRDCDHTHERTII